MQWEPHYVASTWPPENGRQLMMIHLDFGVDDLEAAVQWAVEAGATVADHQPQTDVRVLLDQAGHPFCLFQDAG
ncbi:MAG TPA: VOC family protein [Acidimicrobiia bacterium]|nr:VOC family protein [Acidimicrobiia bacterium]